MKRNIFQQKYANTPIGSRHILLGKGKNCKSPHELYFGIIEQEQIIDEAQKEIERLLEIADKIIK